MFISKKNYYDLHQRLNVLEDYAEKDFKRFGEYKGDIDKLNDVVFHSKKDSDRIYPSLLERLWLNPKPKESNAISILNDKFELAMNYLGISVYKKSATDEHLAVKSIKKPVKKVKKG
jgi:hypothetical protein